MIIIKDEGKEQMRSNMREEMRHGFRGGARMRDEESYRKKKKNGWEDAEDEHYRRTRDSRGRYM